jgi:hypothetical protein
MSKSDIRAREVNPPVSETAEVMHFEGTLVDTPCLVSYDFFQGALVGGSYFIDNADDVADITDYEKLQEMLTKKYGPALSAEHDWKDPYRSAGIDTYGKLAKAIARGDVTLRTIWETRDTRIVLVCTESSSEYNALVFLFYHSLDHLQSRDDSVKERDIDLL